jgi:hypothetical protein
MREVGKCVRFLGRYVLAWIGIVGLFAAFVVAGCWLSGNTDGLFGGYAEMMWMFGVLFAGVLCMSLDVYCNTALALGARRSACFWAEELCALVNVTAALVYAPLVQVLVAPLPGELHNSTPSAELYGLLLPLALLHAQASLLAARTENVRRRTLYQVVAAIVVFGVATMAVAVANAVQDESTLFARLLAVRGPLCGALLALAAVLAVLTWKKYQKAVVRA